VSCGARTIRGARLTCGDARSAAAGLAATSRCATPCWTGGCCALATLRACARRCGPARPLPGPAHRHLRREPGTSQEQRPASSA